MPSDPPAHYCWHVEVIYGVLLEFLRHVSICNESRSMAQVLSQAAKALGKNIVIRHGE